MNYKFTNRDMVTILVKDITIVNVYNQPKPSKKYPEPPVFEFLKREIKEQYSKIVIAGDYNLHHKEWESRAGPNTEADEVVEWLHENDMMLITPRNQKTYNNRTNIDLVYGSVDLLHRISFSGVDENTLSDHSIVEWDISMSQSKNGDEVFTSVKRLNIKNADWEKFDKELSSAIKDFNVHNKTLKSTDQIDDQAKVLEEVVKRAMAKSMKEVKVMKKSKRYWNQELREKLEKALEAKREARQRQPSLALKRQKIEEAKKARKIFDHSLREASTEQWNKYLSSLEGNDIWKILKFLFDEVDSALADTPNDKAPGDDGITGKVLKMAWLNKDFKERFFKLLQACVKFGYHPKVWRHGIIVVIPKPKKPDYSKPRAYRPISLLKIPSKVLEKIIQKRMTKLTTHLLPPEQYGGRQGYCATDAVLELVQRIETSKEKISAMLIDIQGAFDNVNRNILADTMEDMKLPKALINWTYQFVSEREASMLMDR
ncbi:uncharacterized protein SAPINGB_P001082 [Magnusiomyces paraingens]|uniref:Reverse transcriptase domain-containing protein n=1 Tax=Magnusiomyces paraingens TaxID=2606893 RepID=A0A5E8B4H5_9ASCO|nr:uncharacterized protein SAPINGB_P001082 [Saprochaete ingens]VVT46173.1 unnamed protein product [Saprochaete ingens]